MTIRDEFTLLPPGQIAAIVTHLEMHAKPALRKEYVKPGEYAIRRMNRPELDAYRAIYRRVGENWLWFSRLAMDDETLAAIIHDPGVEVHILRHRGKDEGILEIDFRRFPEVEISFLGVVDTLLGKGAGRYLMNRALEIAWARAPKRLTIHTCTLDHPRALEFYLKTGFSPYSRSIEIADDPRLAGILPRKAAPQVPVITGL
ncbi:MAG TPA: GNAT family N-acetyltransferase [Xanthobacteraceae bacterium]|jgi:GNAT superfamily N-acetyltransferase|nr:GNAT family N-acetyltransferase [Xanthobacteraceae bacterium]